MSWPAGDVYIPLTGEGYTKEEDVSFPTFVHCFRWPDARSTSRPSYCIPQRRSSSVLTDTPCSVEGICVERTDFYSIEASMTCIVRNERGRTYACDVSVLISTIRGVWSIQNVSKGFNSAYGMTMEQPNSCPEVPDGCRVTFSHGNDFQNAWSIRPHSTRTVVGS